MDNPSEILVQPHLVEEDEGPTRGEEQETPSVAPAAVPNAPNRNANNQAQRPNTPVLRYAMLGIWKRSCIFFIAYLSPIIFATVAVLVADWNSECKGPLKEWLLALAVHHVVTLVLTAYTLVKLPSPSDSIPRQERGVRSVLYCYIFCRFLDFFWFVWFVLGIVWTATSSDCADSAPNMFGMCVAMIVIHFVLICVVLSLCCCTSFALLMRISSGESAPGGASKKMIQSLQSKKFHTSEMSEEDATCAVCLGTYEEEESLRVLPCKHHFHAECVDKWLAINKSCPLCKLEIDKEGNQEEVRRSVPLEHV